MAAPKGIVRKKDLITAIERQLNIPRKDAQRNLDIMLGTIIAATMRGHTVSIVGFGTFRPKHVSERLGFSVASGTHTVTPDHYMLSFKATKEVNALIEQKAEQMREEQQAQRMMGS